MGTRLDLHEELCELLGSRNAYFQPPESVKLKYPCIVYSLDTVDQIYANNFTYRGMNRYNLVIIDPNPDSDIYIKILRHFQMCRHDRRYPSDNLNHDSLTLYY